ncbi:MAG: hypothetical protein ACRC4Y_07210 [Cetobacterium sp.]
MAWICRLCGKELRVKVLKISIDTHKIDIKGNPSERPSKRDKIPNVKEKCIFCKKCDVTYKDGTKVETVGVWKE